MFIFRRTATKRPATSSQSPRSSRRSEHRSPLSGRHQRFSSPRSAGYSSPLGRRSSPRNSRLSEDLSPRRMSENTSRRLGKSPRQLGVSPRGQDRRGISPVGHNLSPSRRNFSPRKRTPSPRHHEISPRQQQSLSPDLARPQRSSQSVSPVRNLGRDPSPGESRPCSRYSGGGGSVDVSPTRRRQLSASPRPRTRSPTADEKMDASPARTDSAAGLYDDLSPRHRGRASLGKIKLIFYSRVEKRLTFSMSNNKMVKII